MWWDDINEMLQKDRWSREFDDENIKCQLVFVWLAFDAQGFIFQHRAI